MNEHSTDQDVLELRELCRTLKVALVSDCGTPGFCDPGARLVAALSKLMVLEPGDLLVVFAGLYSDDPALRAVVQAAHLQDMSVVLFTGAGVKTDRKSVV